MHLVVGKTIVGAVVGQCVMQEFFYVSRGEGSLGSIDCALLEPQNLFYLFVR